MGDQQYPPGCCVGIQDSLKSAEPIIKNKCPHYRETCWTENFQDEQVGIWNRWVATNIHLDQYRNRNKARIHGHSLDFVNFFQGFIYSWFSPLWSVLRCPKHWYLRISIDCGPFLYVKTLEVYKEPLKRPPSHGIERFWYIFWIELIYLYWFGDPWRYIR